MRDLSLFPDSWHVSPQEVVTECAQNDPNFPQTGLQSVISLIEQERSAVRPYVNAMVNANWADEPQAQESVHVVLVNGVDVTAVCVGFNTAEEWADLLVISGVHADGRPQWIPNRQKNAPLTVRLSGKVEVIMNGAMNKLPTVSRNGVVAKI